LARQFLEQEFEAGQSYKPNKADWLDGAWSGLRSADNQDEQRRGKTSVPMKQLKEIGARSPTIPEGFKAHKTISAFMDNRMQIEETGEGIDWAMAKRWPSARSASRAPEDPPLRPGLRTRHVLAAPFGALRSGDRRPLHPACQPLAPAQARYEVINSMLSEEAVLGFEYGYSLARPQRADALGSPVRRLRQRRAGRLRPVHLVGRTQVAAHVGPRLPAAARL
jgi:2-oxoglutarate dehydrogenase E1 component